MKDYRERVTIYEVASAAGVSVATVSRVLNNAGTVKPDTSAKVLKIIKKLGYRPSGVARSLATNVTTNIGVIIPNANYVYISAFLNGIAEVSKSKGFTLRLYSTSHSKEDALKSIEKIIADNLDGAIVFDDELADEELDILNEYSVPVIVINNDKIGANIGCVNFGYQHTFKNILLEYFSKGDKKMSFLHVHNAGRLLARIEQTFIKVHMENGKDYEIINCDDSYTRTYNNFIERFRHVREDYIVCYRDSIAAAVLNAATDSGLRVPEDVEVLSIIGTKYSEIIRPTISNLYVNMADVGKISMYMLIDLIKGELYEKKYKFESHYIKRNSTRF